MNRALLFTFLFVFVIHYATCAKILGIFPMIAKSHYSLASALMRGLAERGHDVTVINPIGEKSTPKNGSYKDVILTGFLDFDEAKINFFDLGGMNSLTYNLFMNYVGNEVTEKVLAHPNVQALLKSNEKFDVVILEQFVNDALKVFAYHYKAPLILFSTMTSSAWSNPLVGNPAPPSYVFSAEQGNYFDVHDFWGRLHNNALYLIGELNRYFFFFPSQNRIMKKYFPDAPDLDKLNYNASLILLNSHISTNQAVPRVPCMIDIGGFHIQPAKKLPQDLQQFLDGAQDGVIYFSMGSNLKSKQLAVPKREAILKTFSRLKQKVLWKWEDDNLPGQPSNVKLGKWLPQQDILAHPNVRLFITHGGLLSLIETVYHGVPILAIPVFGDQQSNAAGAQWNGYGRFVPYDDLSESNFYENVRELLDNPKYTQNVKRRSELMKDRPMAPLDTADYWIKYVLRYQGAPHLRVSALELAWYQYLSLDVVAFVAAAGLAALILLYIVLKLIVKSLKKKPVSKKKKN